MPCEIKNKERDKESEVSLTSDCRLPDILAFVPTCNGNIKHQEN